MSENINEIGIDDIDSVEWKITATCCFCDENITEYVDRYDTDSFSGSAVKVLNDAGWRIGIGKEQIGITCPECVALIKDGKEPGEDN